MRVILTGWDGHGQDSQDKLVTAAAMLGLTAAGYCDYDETKGYKIIFVGEAQDEATWLEDKSWEILQGHDDFYYNGGKPNAYSDADIDDMDKADFFK